MTDTIIIGTTEVGMSATGSSLLRFRKIFGRDFLAETQKKEVDPALYTQMGYIMAMAYDGADMNKLTEDGFMEWADQFAPMDLINAVGDILVLWSKSQKPTVTPKKKGV
jgi:hypothetical protein